MWSYISIPYVRPRARIRLFPLYMSDHERAPILSHIKMSDHEYASVFFYCICLTMSLRLSSSTAHVWPWDCVRFFYCACLTMSVRPSFSTCLTMSESVCLRASVFFFFLLHMSDYERMLTFFHFIYLIMNTHLSCFILYVSSCAVACLFSLHVWLSKLW